jgi:hypothetical protein
VSADAAFIGRKFVLAEFPSADALLDGTRRMREKGHAKIDTHTPYPIHGLEAALGIKRVMIPTIVLGGAIMGVVSALAMMIYMNVIDFPLNVGNRPALAGPALIPITFELAVLLGGSSAFFGLLIGLLKFPEPYHPLFELEAFRRASIDGFFLSVEVPESQNAEDVALQARELGANDTHIVVESER